MLLGQDPYHDLFNNEPRAQGLSFANPSGTTLESMSYSLRIMHGELENDLKTLALNFDPTLKNWAEQGVLLLNTALTVEKGKANSHKVMWHDFTVKVIEHLDKMDNIVWILLGKQAQSYKVYMKDDLAPPLTVETAHPAACRYGNTDFIGSRIFSKTNEMLKMLGKEPIIWYNKFKV